MRLLVIGGKGQLGQAIAAEWNEADRGKATVVDLPEIDVTDWKSVRRAIYKFPSPEIVVNCAAFTDVDGCEKDPDRAYAINYQGAMHVAAACLMQNSFVVQISTDYVFDGRSTKPYTEADEPNPINVYGHSKLLGERAVASHCPHHAIVRTAWLYSRDGMANGRPTFVNKIAEMVKEDGEPLRVVNDQIGNPTSVGYLAEAINSLVFKHHHGLYHLTCGGVASRYDLAVAIRDIMGSKREVLPVPTEHFPKTPAERPPNTSLRTLWNHQWACPPNWRKCLLATIGPDNCV